MITIVFLQKEPLDLGLSSLQAVFPRAVKEKVRE